MSLDALSVSGDAGLSSTSRLHHLMVSCEAMIPGEIRAGDAGLKIRFGFAPSPFGEAIAGWTRRGICHFEFSTADPETMAARLAACWPKAFFCRDDRGAQTLMHEIFPSAPARGRVHLLLLGTNFQIKVWEALIRTDFGSVTSYRRLAEHAGNPRAQRAVGSALAANHIGYLIPCHRVLRESGDAGNYRWGAERKLTMLAWETGQVDR